MGSTRGVRRSLALFIGGWVWTGVGREDDALRFLRSRDWFHLPRFESAVSLRIGVGECIGDRALIEKLRISGWVKRSSSRICPSCLCLLRNRRSSFPAGPQSEI